MSEAETLEKPETGTSIAVIVESNPSIVLLNVKSKDDLFNHIRSEISAFKPDLTTAKGRDAIKSFAFKITRTKTAVDDAGKKLTEEWRAKTSAVNEARNAVKQELTDMATSVRKPLTDWEAAEELRVKECRDTIQGIKSAMNVYIEDTSETVRARGKEIYEITLDADRFGEMLAEAQDAKDTTVASLRSALARLTQEEADKAELARLKRAEADRLAKEEADRAAEEQRQREQEAIERQEREAREAQEAEAQRIEQARLQAAEDARIEAEQKAEQERRDAEQSRIDAEAKAKADREREDAEKQRIHEEALAAERLLTQEAEQREADRIAKEQQDQAERAAREADQAHRASVKTAAKEALIATGASNALATKIVMAILAGDIPSVRLEF